MKKLTIEQIAASIEIIKGLTFDECHRIAENYYHDYGGPHPVYNGEPWAVYNLAGALFQKSRCRARVQWEVKRYNNSWFCAYVTYHEDETIEVFQSNPYVDYFKAKNAARAICRALRGEQTPTRWMY